MRTERSVQLCRHCGEEVPTSRATSFCCNGCESVYEFIRSKGLGHYYDIRDQLGRRQRPASYIAEDFSYLDEPDFLAAYSKPVGEHRRQMQFYLEGVHCSACVWVVEKLAGSVEGIERVRLDLGNHVATVVSSSDHFAQAAQEMSKLGYRPHPVKDGSEEALLRSENRRFLARVAVAGACAGNIMLLAISLYSGLAGGMAAWFDRISGALFLPVLLYSATPLLKSAWTSLRQKSISIDVPVALGILLGSATSYFNLFTGSHQLYFDSLSVLVFLLLGSRYLLRRAHQSSLAQSHLLHFVTPASARRRADGKAEIVRVDSLKLGDLIEVRAGETVPCDGRIVRGTAAVDASLLTGESRPQTLAEGDSIFAGTVNRSGCLCVQVQQMGYQTRLGRILKSAEASISNKAHILTFSDQVARTFTIALLALIIGVFFFRLHYGWNSALNQALALSLVACPCAFALAAPLAMSMSIGKLARARILVKGSDSLEKLAQAREVFIDKTGTLTQGELQVNSWVVEPTEQANRIERAVVAIEGQSNHPVARALVSYLKGLGTPSEPQKVREFVETIGRGVRARFEGALFEISGDTKTGSILVSEDGVPVAKAWLSDLLRKDSEKATKELKALDLEIHLLSGDQKASVSETADSLGIPESRVYWGVTPERKAEILKAHPRALMVGDGANDAAALAAAFVGVAVHNGAEISLRASDIYSCDPGVRSVVRLIVAGRETLRVIRRNFTLSLLYNITAAIGAAMGKIDPLFAAVLMPVSAFTLFISSISGTKRLRQVLGKEGP